ncbi:hypothetical protein AB835_00350 [Candidatus Endobugula sertula]|uniref:Serine aminopeptidase S33 domain-containing protein n=1 Tax=Candidatus Endobugula sertula TaxID=62101 RepID=A0A1D2QTS5_9GAMM|nr:hypothetical protein AB835_00350 [Candidatus Endobugula sertula]
MFILLAIISSILYSLTIRFFEENYDNCVNYLSINKNEQLPLALKSKKWLEYYRKFNINEETIREPGHAKIFKHTKNTEKAIILLHGLTDSTFSLTDLSEHFYSLGYDVYLPLLSHHGVKNMESMKGVTLESWIDNVNYAVDEISESYKTISMGGLSMGALLSFYISQKDVRINGDVFLFSVPFELKPQYPGIIGKIQELYVFNVDERNSKALTDGTNPYAYARMDRYGLRELVRLMKKVEKNLSKEKGGKYQFKNNILAFHSEHDKSAYIQPVKRLNCHAEKGSFKAMIIPEKNKVAHGSIVMNKTIYRANGNSEEHIIKKKNPFFSEIAKTISEFTNKKIN